MKLLFQDPHAGVLKLLLQTPSDLWRLSRLIAPGDLVGAVTTRRDSDAPTDTPAAQRSRRTLFLTVVAERIEFHEFSGHVRVTGPIAGDSPEAGRYHTLDLEVDADVTLTKRELSGPDRALLEEGLESPDEPALLVVSADTSLSAVVRLKGRSLEVVDERDSRGLGKYAHRKAGGHERDREAYLESLLEVIEPELSRSQAVVLAGPGFLKEELARRLGRSRPAVANSLRLLHAAPGVRGAVAEGQLSAGHARALLAVDDVGAQEALAGQVIRSGLSVRETERIVQKHAQAGRARPETAPRARTPEWRDAEERLRNALGTRVRIQGTAKKGTVEIDFYGLGDLERLIELLGGG